ncbi:MAG: beta-lactamase [Bacteroidetes bacterium]|nr:beta-lactamase [Bacteroidota bacterium]
MEEQVQTRPVSRSPWAWIPTLYFAEGLPYVVVMTVSVIMYKRFGISNTDIALYTSWLYLPWVIKPLWSPFVDIFSRKRTWIIVTQLLIGGALAAAAAAIPLPLFFQITLAIFWLMAFASATHDIAADGFYLLGLPEHHQSAFVGVRNTFYRLAMIAGQGAIVVLAGSIEDWSGGNVALAWSSAFAVLASLFPLFAFYHKFFLPVPESDRPALDRSSGGVLKEFFQTFTLFFGKKDIGFIVAFLLFYRFAEAQLVKLVPPFLLDVREKGGLGLSTSEVGIVYGTVGIIALTLGGLVGGYVVSRGGLKRWLWIMVLAIHLPDAVFVYLSQAQPTDFVLITSAVAVEQFGYGFGFTAYVLFMMMISQGEHRTAHYAICTGFMALGMMLPGMFSGFIQESLGYKGFFLWILASTIPGFIVAALVKIEPGFGRHR